MRLVHALLLLAISIPARAQAPEPSAPLPSLTELAAAADLVALAQVRDTDYRLQRDIPVSGSAYLRILIVYKHPGHGAKPELVEVYEKGLHEHECYFPNPTVFEEGRRYLLFLRRDAEDPERYRGLPQGCALEVLVARDNRYAVRFPPAGIALRDPLDRVAVPMDFADPYAVVEDEALSPAERNALRDEGHIVATGEGLWQFTRGVDLGAVRRLIAPEALAN